MKTQYYTAASLDGFVATEDDSLEWLFPLGDVKEAGYPAFIAQVGAIAMGASTYEWMLRHSEKVLEDSGSAWPFTQPTWVFTHRDLPPIAGADVRFVQGSVKAAHARMMEVAGGKNIWIAGGGELAAQFHDAGLLDEAIIQIGSVTLGQGKPLFPRRVTNPPWRLLSVRQIGSGLAELHYALPRAPLGQER
ncbi:dihydrofolate reductase family protein [Synechococcus sp. CS-1332]|uniref:dihydrofolate reductase family protein n=1 Tax=Synechococcus sp. CS-1332 TaxID=2847972 RepID=UPI00223A74DA|nr:dihydrofolate reductase family protein [Synechococcus sp. CS-1332]MCT0206386.1 dihydrofolate reductase family protein [Synechococcus sp. CS-1332]